MNAPETITPPANAVAVAMLPVAAMVASPSNPRHHFDATYIAELADSIKSHGIIQPITVRPLSLDGLFEFNRTRHEDDERPTYELVVGECRWRAAKLAGLVEIPAFWRELDDKQVLEIQVIENLQRRDVHPLEEAEGYQALMQRHGYKAEQLAAKVGKSRSYIFGRLKLTALCAAAREAFFEGKLDASTALLIARIPGEGLQKKALKDITQGYNNEPLSYRAAKQQIRSRYTLNLMGATFKADDATLLPAAGACSACPKRSGNDRDLFNDIDSADVCTDPDCFEAKRQARRDQLIAHAEARKIPVITGDAARDAWHDDKYIRLDEQVEDDADDRTWREILGDKAVVAAVIERPWGDRDPHEFGNATALEKALKQAGWKPADEPPPYVPPNATPEEKKAAAAQAAKRKAEAEEWDRKKEAVERENTWRDKLATELLRRVELDTNNGNLNTDRAIILLAHAWMQQNEIEYNFPEDLLQRYGVELPTEYDEDVEMARIFDLMEKWSVGTALAFLLDALTENYERRVNLHDGDIQPPRILLAAAALVGLDAEALRDPAKVQPKTAKAKPAKPASTPSDAAQAPAQSAQPAAPAETKPAKKAAAKKPKAKADPAPTTSANEPAAPVTAGKLNPAHAWPFPVGPRP